MCICTDTFFYISAGYNGKIKFIASHSARHSILLLSFIISYMYTYFFFGWSLICCILRCCHPQLATYRHVAHVVHTWAVYWFRLAAQQKQKKNLWTERAARAREKKCAMSVNGIVSRTTNVYTYWSVTHKSFIFNNFVHWFIFMEFVDIVSLTAHYIEYCNHRYKMSSRHWIGTPMSFRQASEEFHCSARIRVIVSNK